MSGFYRWLDDNGIGAGKPRMLAEFGTDVNSEDRGAKQRWFEDRQGWRNDHTDWLARDVWTFRKRLRRLEG